MLLVLAACSSHSSGGANRGSDTSTSPGERRGGASGGTIHAFPSSARCVGAGAEQWVDEPASERLWATAQGGEVVLTTTGDGVFRRE
jgi:hypothetical protein